MIVESASPVLVVKTVLSVLVVAAESSRTNCFIVTCSWYTPGSTATTSPGGRGRHGRADRRVRVFPGAGRPWWRWHPLRRTGSVASDGTATANCSVTGLASMLPAMSRTASAPVFSRVT